MLSDDTFLRDFKSGQKEFELGGVRVGGKPGVRPVVLIGTLFYRGHKILLDEFRGEFDKAGAERAINAQEEFSDKTGNPCMIDVVGATSEAMRKHLEYAANVSDRPLLIDGATASVRMAGLEYASEANLTNRVVYNSLQPDFKPEEACKIRESKIESSILLAYNPKDFTSRGRINAIRGLLPRAKEIGIGKPLIDTCVLDLASLGQACRSMVALKDELGYPVGNGAHNAIALWRGLKVKLGEQAVKPCTASAMAMVAAMGADFILYGPLEDAKYVFPAVAMVDTALSQLVVETGIRPERSHPRFRVG